MKRSGALFKRTWGENLIANAGIGLVAMLAMLVGAIPCVLLIVVGGLYVFDYWTTLQQASEIAELDSALLGSDLPVDAFLDKGFENWLKRSGQ